MDDENAIETETNQETSQDDRLGAIEQKLDQVLALLDPAKNTEREQAAHAARHTKVPYVKPDMPAGLSPNQIIEHRRATGVAPVATVLEEDQAEDQLEEQNEKRRERDE